MKEVEDDNVYITRMTANVSGDSELDGQSEEKFYGPGIGSPENAACFYSRGARDSLV